MFESFTNSPNDSRRGLAWGMSLAVHVTALAALGTLAVTSAPSLLSVNPEQAEVLRIVPSLRLPPQLRASRPVPPAPRTTVVPARFAAPPPVPAAEPHVAILAAPTIKLPSLPEPLQDVPTVQIDEPHLPTPAETQFGAASAAQDGPAALPVRSGIFPGAGRRNQESESVGVSLVAGFGQASLSQARRSTGKATPAGFSAIQTEQVGRSSAGVETANFGAARRQLGVGSDKPLAPDTSEHPVRILWKPVPEYTDAARERRIEGDVVLLVRFLARGAVETLRVVSGLGCGLDEHAVNAAMAIRFKPATHNNQPIDYIAQVRIRFELAY
jgi:TonB family protein